MIKIVFLFAIICAVSVQGEECFAKTKTEPSEEVKKHLQECQQEVKENNMDKITMCMAKKAGTIDANGKIVYDKFVKQISSAIVSENKRKIIVAELGKCKEKDPNLGRDFVTCYATVIHKECSP